MSQRECKGRESAPGGAGGPDWGRGGDALAVGAPAPVSGNLSSLETSDISGEGNDGRGYLLNLETGERVAIDEPWKLRARRCYRRVEAWAQLVMAEVQQGRGKVIRVGLTLRPGEEWRPRLVSEFAARLRKEMGPSLLGYCTVTEMQARGAAHFNFIIWHDRRYWFPKPDKAGWWRHGSTDVTPCKSVRDVMYAARYVGKEGQKGGPGGPPLPRGAHLYSIVVRAHLTGGGRVLLALSRLPEWLRLAVQMDAIITGTVPVKCGYWTDQSRRRGEIKLRGWWFNGRHYASPWKWSRE